MQTGFAKCHTSKLYSAPHLAEKSSYTQNLNFLLKVFVKCDLRELNTQSAKQYPQINCIRPNYHYGRHIKIEHEVGINFVPVGITLHAV